MVNSSPPRFSSSNFDKLIAAIPTPYDREMTVDRYMLEVLVEDYIARGVEGIYCCGSSGEGLLLSLEERRYLFEIVVSTVGNRVPVVTHIGGLATRDAIELARHAEEFGASAVSMVPPIYYNYSDEAFVNHFKEVTDSCSLPMLIYNIPQFTGTEINGKIADKILDDEQVVGFKQTSHDMFALERLRSKFPDKVFINGFDEIYLSALAAGANGSIGTTIGIQLELFKAVRTFFNRGDMTSAMRVQSRINDVIEELVSIDVFPAAKYLSGIKIGDLGPCRLPFPRLDKDSQDRLHSLSDIVEHNIRLTREELAHAD